MSVNELSAQMGIFLSETRTRYSEESVIINGYTVEEAASDTDISFEEVQKLAAGLALTIS